MSYVTFDGTPEELQALDIWEEVKNTFGAKPATTALATPDTPPPTTTPPSSAPALDARLDSFISDRGGNNPSVSVLRKYAAEAVNNDVAEWHIGSSKQTPDGLAKYFSLYAPGPRRFGAVSYVHPVNGRTTFRLSWDDPAIADVKKLAFKASDEPDATYAVGIMLTSEAALIEAQALLARAVEIALR